MIIFPKGCLLHLAVSSTALCTLSSRSRSAGKLAQATLSHDALDHVRTTGPICMRCRGFARNPLLFLDVRQLPLSALGLSPQPLCQGGKSLSRAVWTGPFLS